MALFKRLAREYVDFMRSGTEGMAICPMSEVQPDGVEMPAWKIWLEGPAQTPYAGGVFELVVKFPALYPFRPFKLHFATPIWHPGVCSTTGRLCCCAIGGRLDDDAWTPVSSVRDIIHCSLVEAMMAPDLRTICHREHESWPHDIAAAEAEACKWTAAYATGAVANLFLEARKRGLCVLSCALCRRDMTSKAVSRLNENTVNMIRRELSSLCEAQSDALSNRTSSWQSWSCLAEDVFFLDESILDNAVRMLVTLAAEGETWAFDDAWRLQYACHQQVMTQAMWILSHLSIVPAAARVVALYLIECGDGARHCFASM